MKKILCLVLDSDPHEDWGATYGRHRLIWNRCFDDCPWVEGYFIRSDPSLGSDSTVFGRQFVVRGEETFATVLNKTVKAIDALLTDHDYVVRTNNSSLYDFLLLDREELPKKGLYSGELVDGKYVTGSGILMSNDVARAVAEGPFKEVSDWDDEAIGQILESKGILPVRREMFAYDYSRGLDQLQVGRHLHYRLREYSSPVRALERAVVTAVYDRIYSPLASRVDSHSSEVKRAPADGSDTELYAVFEKHGTDKGRNGYAGMYDRILTPLRRRPLRILEIGIGTLEPHAFSTMVGFHGPGYAPGGSLRAFRDYCPNATLLGLDVQSDTQFSEERIETGICNSTDALSVAQFFAWRRDEPFDLVIDDGGHRAEMQVATLANFHSKVREGGHYVIEDVNGEDSYVFHFWEAIVGPRFRMVERRVNALVLERRRRCP